MQTIQNAIPVYAWIDGVEFEDTARAQVANMATLPFIHHHIAVMPDVHFGLGATVGSVIPTLGAIVPASVGVDIGCGMVAQRLSLRADQLPDNLSKVREVIEKTIPVGFASHEDDIPQLVQYAFEPLASGLHTIIEKFPKLNKNKAACQMGTMGGGNHFCEITIDTEGTVWVVIHSGSRGIGNKIGTFFISEAKKDMERQGITLADKDLAYLTEDTERFNDYMEAVNWAQAYARANRDTMMEGLLGALRDSGTFPEFTLSETVVNCHHNYISKEYHFGEEVYVTRKGAVSAKEGELGIIPGSMGARSFIVSGKGNPDSFASCSHGAGRRMGRKQAERLYTVQDLVEQTAGIECRKDAGVLDELPSAYKDIGAVMDAQSDLVDIKFEMKQVLCVKG